MPPLRFIFHVMILTFSLFHYAGFIFISFRRFFEIDAADADTLIFIQRLLFDITYAMPY